MLRNVTNSSSFPSLSASLVLVTLPSTLYFLSSIDFSLPSVSLHFPFSLPLQSFFSPPSVSLLSHFSLSSLSLQSPFSSPSVSLLFPFSLPSLPRPFSLSSLPFQFSFSPPSISLAHLKRRAFNRFSLYANTIFPVSSSFSSRN